MAELERPRPGPPGIMDPGKANVQTIYVLNLAGFVFAISTILGVFAAYSNRGKAEAWLDSHYTWAIRTFWIAIVLALVSFLLSFVLIGYLGFIITALWVIARCMAGLLKAGRNEPISDPESWFI